MSIKKIKGEVVDQYLVDYPNEFNRTLARRIVADRGDLFEDVEQVRSLIRLRKGTAGVKRKQGNELKGYEGIVSVMRNYNLSAQQISTTEPFTLPLAHNNIGLLSDIHIPYHDSEVIGVVLDYFVSKKVNTIIINGDLIDFYQLSRFSRDPLRKDVSYEVNQTIEFFEFLREIFPTQNIYWKLGNHEDRFEFYMRSNAKEMIGLDDFKIQSIFELDKFNIKLIGSKQRIIAGKLNIVHGHEFGNSIFSPVNPARGLFLRSKANIIAGHNHQSSEHHENNINGDAVGCWSTGCLCELSPEYSPFAYTKWNHGAAHLMIDSDKNFTVDNFRVIDGKIR